MSGEAKALGGPVMTRGFKVILAVLGLGLTMTAWRFIGGIGAVTNLNDGYAWGLWIAFDVVIGTALACGGYAVAILVYIFNRGQYHPLVRPALLTSALGYSAAAFGIILDVGRYIYIYRIPIAFGKYNWDSALLEVALCVMAYIIVLWLELAPAFLEKWRESRLPVLRRASATFTPIMKKALLWIIALGILLPTMHQSSLGTVMLLAGRKLHPLWNTPLIPLLFLISCIAMGYAMVVIEAVLASLAFKRPPETKMLGAVSLAIVPTLGLFLVIRFVDLAWRGRLGTAFALDSMSAMYLLESLLFLAPALMLLSKNKREDLGHLFRAAVLMILAGSLYRIDAYIVAFNPGEGWTYFPAVPEILISIGVVTMQIVAYVLIVRFFPILSGVAPATRGKQEAV